MTDDDWRLMGREKHLAGVELRQMPYRQYGTEWDHDHCSFCNAKFVPADVAETEAYADREVVTAGYATTEKHARGAEYYWVCETCFGDFNERFGWRIVAAP